MEGAGQIQKPTSPLKLVLSTLKNEGISGLYKGYWITCLRDIPGGAGKGDNIELKITAFSTIWSL